MPKVSVIIPTHQRANLVTEAIESVLSQTYHNYEIIVVDDSSTDNTREILNSYINKKIINYYYTDAKSAAYARNLAIKHAKGEYLAFLDSDDLWIPEKLELQVAYFRAHPEIGLLHGGFSKFGFEGKDLGYRDTSHLSGNVYPKILFDWSVLIMISTVMVPAEVIHNVGTFKLGIPAAEDLEMWARIARSYTIHGIPLELVKVRVHSGNISGDKAIRPENFMRYLTACFENDPKLDRLSRRRIISKMFGNAGKNLLGHGSGKDMKNARQFSLRSILLWPVQLEAYLNIPASWLSPNVRYRLYQLWYRHKYKLNLN